MLESNLSAHKDLEVLSERTYFKRRLADVETYLVSINVLIAVLAIGAVLGGTNALHASFMSRRQELATLLTIGFTRMRIVVLVLYESLLLTLGGGAIGILLSLLSHGRSLSYSETGLNYSAQVSPRSCWSAPSWPRSSASSGCRVGVEVLRDGTRSGSPGR